MGRKRKGKPPVVATCHLCEHFFHSKLLKNDQVHNPRLCISENHEILSTDPICENFVLATYFYCDRTNHQITIQNCHQRKSRSMEECRKCKQYDQVLVAEATVGVSSVPVRTGPLKIRTVRNIDEESAVEEPQKPRLKKRAEVTIWEKPVWD